MRLSFSRSPPGWLQTGRATSQSETVPNGTFCARSGPAWTPVSQARNRRSERFGYSQAHRVSHAP